MSAADGGSAKLEALLFKATSPSNKIEDVNTIKAFCDAVTETGEEGPALACRLLAHKIQSPQEREAVHEGVGDQGVRVIQTPIGKGVAFHGTSRVLR